jgi:hypothetical protein
VEVSAGKAGATVSSWARPGRVARTSNNAASQAMDPDKVNFIFILIALVQVLPVCSCLRRNSGRRKNVPGMEDVFSFINQCQAY